jgi:hypothetical protein
MRNDITKNDPCIMEVFSMSRSKNSIDVSDLSDKDIKIVQEFVKMLRVRTRKELSLKSQDEKIVFATRESDVIGSLTREEIYDYL